VTSSMDGLLNALHYPVARAREHYYSRYVDAITLLLRTIVRNSNPDALVLDVGCGYASYATPWREFCRYVVGMDMSPTIRNNTWVGSRVRGDAYHVPLPQNSVDLIIMRFVVEHLERPLDALREAARVLRPGGKLVLLTPNRRHYVAQLALLTPLWFHRWYFGRLGWAEEEIYPTLYRANTPGELKKAAGSVGLHLAELEMYEGPPGYLEGYWVPYLLGVAYERLVNRFRALAGFRTCMLATLQKPS